MDFNIQPGQLAKNGLRVTMLAAAVAVASCGGGGSSSGVGNAGQNPSTPTAPASKYHLLMEASKLNLDIAGDTAEITLKAFDNFGGGVADQQVTLQLPDISKTGLSIVGPSTAVTGADGSATFVVKLTKPSAANQQELLDKGILIQGLLVDSNNAQSRQALTLNVVQSGSQISQYTLDLSADHVPVNVKGDTITLSLLARDNEGVGAADQAVSIGLPTNLAGVSIEGSASTRTDESGRASFTLKVASGLTPAQVNALITQGLAVSARLVEANGARVITTKLLSASQPNAQFALLVETDAGLGLNVYGDTVKVTVKVTSLGTADPQGQLVNVALMPKMTGVQFEGATSARTDATGEATFTLKVVSGLSEAAIQELLNTQFAIGATVTESSGASTNTAITLNAVRPAPEYNLQIEKNKTSLLASGDSMVVTARVVDKNGGGVAEQRVSLALTTPEGVVIDGPSTLLTDDKGRVDFNVLLSDKLTTAQREALVKSGLSFRATLVESSGASVSTPTQSVMITQSGSTTESQYEPVISVSKPTVNAYGDTWQVVVRAKDTNGGGVAGQSMTLKLPKVAGLVIDGASTVVTDDKGDATFNIKNLSLGDLRSLLIEAVLTEANGAKASATFSVQVEKPVAQYTPVISLSQSQVGVDGGIVEVAVRALNSTGGSVAGQQVTLSLPNNFKDAVIDGASTAVTNAQGVASFKVAVRAGVVAQTIGLGAIIIESNGAVSQAATASIAVVDVQADYSLKLSGSKTRLNVLGDSITVSAQLASKSGSSVANQTVALAWNPRAGGISVSSATAKTDSAGVATFTLTLSDLTAEEQQALLSSGLSISAAVSRNNQTVQSAVLSVASFKPTAQYTPVISLSQSQVGVDGGIVEVAVRALNSTGGSVANQQVTLSLPSNFKDAVIDGASTVTTNAQGVASFKVIVKSGIAAQTIGLGAVITEGNGAVSQAATASIAVVDVQADYSLKLSGSKTRLNVLGDSITVSAQLASKSGSSVADQTVALAWNPQAGGISVSSATAKTDSAGVATFTLTLSDLTAEEQQALLSSGLSISAAVSRNNQTVQSAVLSVASFKPTAQYTPVISLSQSQVGVDGGIVEVAVRALNSTGGSVAGQQVTLSLPNNFKDAVIDGASTVTTNAQGVASFKVVVKSGIAAQTIGLGAVITEGNGAVSQAATASIAVVDVQADYSLKLSGSKTRLNVLGDSITVSAQLASKSGSSVADQTVALAWNPQAGGISVSSATAKTDSAGVATFTLTLSDLTAEEQQALLSSGLSISAAVSRNNQTVQSAVLSVASFKPTAQYTPVISLSQSQVGVDGGIVEVAVRALNSTGGSVANQQVTLSLPSNFKDAVIDGASTVTTNAQGVASFKVVVKSGIAAQTIGLGAVITEGNGAVSQAATASIAVVDVQADYSLKLSGSKTRLNVLGDSITVSAQLASKSGSSVADQTVALAWNPQAGGISVSSATAKTDSAGVATFTLTLSDLTAEEQQALLSSGLSISAAVSRNNQTVQSAVLSVASFKPTAQYTPVISLSQSQVGVDGGIVEVAVRALNSTGGSVAGQQVTLSLPNNFKDAVIDGASTVTTNAQGVASFKVIVKSGIAAQTIGLGAVITEGNGAVSQAATASIAVVDVQADYSLKLSGSKTRLNVLGDSITVSAQLASKSGSSVADQTVALAWNPQASGISVGSLTAKTDSNGLASFSVSLADLTAAEQQSLLTTGLTFSAAMTRNAQTVQASTLSVVTFKPASQYQLSVQLNKAKLNVEGDTAEVTVQASNIAGGTVTGQTVRLAVNPQISGVYIQGDSLLQTNSAGQAKFVLSLAGLTATQKQQLIDNGLSLQATLTEANGASTVQSLAVAAYQPSKVSDYQLGLRLSQPRLNVYGDELSVTVLATDTAGKAVANQNVTLSFPAIAGFELTTNATLVTNSSGQAVFRFRLDSGLSAAERQTLINNGVALTAVLTEASGATAVLSQTLQAYEPAAAYQIAMASSSSAINPRGETVSVSVQVLDAAGGLVRDQVVDLGLSGLASLVSLNGEAGTTRAQVKTDDAGIAKFTITVPNNLTASQRDQLISSGLFAAVRVVERSGAVNVQTLALNFANPVSSSQLLVSSNKMSVNPGDSFVVNVQALADDQRPITGQQVNFALSSAALAAGVVAEVVTASTDTNGRAQFTVTVPKTVDQAVLNNLINYAVTLTEANGALNTQVATVSIIQPVRLYSFLLSANKIVQTSGDTFKVFARATDSAGNPAANQQIRLSVADPIRTGVTITGDAQVQTDADGLAVFDLTLTPGANVDQDLLTRGIMLNAVLTEDSGIQTRQAMIVPVDTLNTTGRYVISWTQSKSSFTGFGDEIELTYRVTDANGGVLAGVPVALRIQDALVAGATLTTPARLTTNAEGLIVTRVRLTGRDLDALLSSDIVQVVASVQALRTQPDSTLDVYTLAEQTVSLSKGGGASLSLESSRTVLRSGESTTVTVTFKDAEGRPVANAPVQIVDENNNDAVLNTTTLQTDATGRVQTTLTYSQLTFAADGRARISAIVRGSQPNISRRAAESVTIVSATDALFSFVSLPETVSAVDTYIPVTMRIRAATAAELVGSLTFNTSLGRVSLTSGVNGSANQTVVTLNGISDGTEGNMQYRDVTVFVRSGFPGIAVLNASYQRINPSNGQVISTEQISADIRLRAVTPAKLMLQAEQTVLVPNQSTRIVAIVKDANDSPVSGAEVRFERLVDTSAGRLSAATAITNDAGVAVVTYTAGSSAPLDRVEINAIVESNPAIRPQPGVLTLTVAQQAAYITVGNSDRVRASGDNIYYYHPYSMAVIDGSGRPVANQAVSVQLFASDYAKGFWRLVPVVINGDTVNVWQLFNYQSCDTEDQNRNFTLDLGEDLNGNGKIEAANPVAIIANNVPADVNGVVTFVTDNEGKFDFEVRYPKIYSQWLEFEMKATTRVFGSEYTSVTLQGLPVAAADITTNDGGTRPNITSPFGTVPSCNSPD
jgi:protocatechuate 3,4-dioxygenase beta subunit